MSTCAAVMQPTFAGWLGYFDLFDQADVFILDDLAAVNLKSWQTRNRIRARDGNTTWLSIPVLHAGRGMPLTEVRIANEHPWQAKHSRTLNAAYSHTPYWQTVDQIVGAYTQVTHLTRHTIRLIRRIATTLGIEARLALASELGVTRTDRIGRLADMLNAVDATEMLDTDGARDVLKVDEIEGTPIRWHDYQHPIYSQGDQPFLPYLSVIDLIAWHGPGALEIIRSGRRALANVVTDGG